MSGPWRDWPSDLPRPAPVQTLADLIAEVAAAHVKQRGGNLPSICRHCAEPWGDNGCKPARLAAALSVENVAAGLASSDLAVWSHTTTDWLSGAEAAAALLAAITVA